MAPCSVLVTGAAGFAGSHLLDLLAQDAAVITAWYRPSGRPPRTVGQVRWRAVDVLQPAAVRRAIEEASPHLVYHCAGASHVGGSWGSTESTFAINVRGTHHVVEALHAVRPQARFFVTSSALVYATQSTPLDETAALGPASPYAVSKLAQELVAVDDARRLHVTVARAFNHIGPRQSDQFAASAFARQIAAIEGGQAAPEIRVGNLESARDLTDVRDTVRAYQRIANHGLPGRIYNVCSGRAVRVRELLDLLLARARVAVTVRLDPALYRPNDNPLVVGSPARLRDELGWTPEIPLERTLDDLLDYWRKALAGR